MAEQLEQSLIAPEADQSSSSSKPGSSSSNNNPPAPSSKTESTSSVTAVDTSSGGGNNNKGDDDDNDDDMLLVTEFPPPPYYYTLASRHTPANQKLTPPPIPHRAFKVAAKRVMNERKKAREESDRIRLDAEGEGGGEGSDAMDVDKEEKEAGESSSSTKKHLTEEEEDDDSIDPNNPNEPVVAVFGEIVEDPTLIVEEECHDPIEIRENVKKLNRSVLNGFLKLVQQLVHDPNDNKKLRDELSHNLFLMLQECNKFREHQAREILIETLEQQLERRKEGLSFLNKQINEADDALAALQKFKDTS